MSPQAKLWVYIGIAATTALASALGEYKAFSDIGSVKIAVIALNVVAQGLIAAKAFMSNPDIDKEGK